MPWHAMQFVTDPQPALCSPARSTIQLFMWLPHTEESAHFFVDCLTSGSVGQRLMLMMLYNRTQKIITNRPLVQSVGQMLSFTFSSQEMK